jgi:hypothetical protein
MKRFKKKEEQLVLLTLVGINNNWVNDKEDLNRKSLSFDKKRVTSRPDQDKLIKLNVISTNISLLWNLT